MSSDLEEYEVHTIKSQSEIKQKIYELSHHSLYSLMTMDISQVYQFQKGIKKYFGNERILFQMMSILGYTKKTKKDQNVCTLFMKCKRDKNKIKVLTQQIRDKLIKQPLSQSILRDLSLRKLIKLRIGFRAHFNQEVFLINLVQRRISNKIYQVYGIQKSNKKFQSKQKEEFFYKIKRFIYDLFYIIDLSYVQLIKFRELLQKQSKQDFLTTVIDRMIKNQYSQGRISLQNQKQYDVMKIQTQQDILLTMTHDFNIEKKSLSWLKNFQTNLEKYFQKEVTLIQIIKNRIFLVEKGITKQQEYIQSKKMMKMLKQQEQDSHSLVFSLKKSIFGLYKAIKFNKQEKQNQKKNKISKLSENLLSDEDDMII